MGGGGELFCHRVCYAPWLGPSRHNGKRHERGACVWPHPLDASAHNPQRLRSEFAPRGVPVLRSWSQAVRSTGGRLPPHPPKGDPTETRGCRSRHIPRHTPQTSADIPRPAVHCNSGGGGGGASRRCEVGEGGSVPLQGPGLICPQGQNMGGEPDLPNLCVKSRIAGISDVLRGLWWARPLGPH